MDMKARVTLELDSRSPSQVTELVVCNCQSSDGEVEGLTDEWAELQSLSMVNVGLSSLAKLPSLPKLRKLEVSDNSISRGLDTLADKCPNLSYLNLSGNKVEDLSTLKALQNLKNLKTLDLYSCAVTTLDDYRDGVFDLLPQIASLDGFDHEGEEVPESEDEDEDNCEAGPHGGDEDDDDDEEEDEDEEEDDDSEGEEVGLSYLMKEGIQDEDDDGDYVEEEEEEEEDEEEGDGDAAGVRGEKRKRDPEDDGDDVDEDDE